MDGKLVVIAMQLATRQQWSYNTKSSNLQVATISKKNTPVQTAESKSAAVFFSFFTLTEVFCNCKSKSRQCCRRPKSQNVKLQTHFFANAMYWSPNNMRLILQVTIYANSIQAVAIESSTNLRLNAWWRSCSVQLDEWMKLFKLGCLDIDLQQLKDR